MFSSGYGLYTECAQSRGPENVGLKRTCPPAMARTSVQSPSNITLEYNGKIRPQPDRENAFAGASGGGRGPEVQPSPPTETADGSWKHDGRERLPIQPRKSSLNLSI